MNTGLTPLDSTHMTHEYTTSHIHICKYAYLSDNTCPLIHVESSSSAENGNWIWFSLWIRLLMILRHFWISKISAGSQISAHGFWRGSLFIPISNWPLYPQYAWLSHTAHRTRHLHNDTCEPHGGEIYLRNDTNRVQNILARIVQLRYFIVNIDVPIPWWDG